MTDDDLAHALARLGWQARERVIEGRRAVVWASPGGGEISIAGRGEAFCFSRGARRGLKRSNAEALGWAREIGQQ